MSALLQADEASALLEATIKGELPDESGRFGPFGGRYVPETLVPAFERPEQGVHEHLHDAAFQEEFQRELREWVGRPTALTFAPRLSESWGAEVWLKREDLAHTGAHKINNAIGQAILAKRLGAQRIIAETGAGQHGGQSRFRRGIAFGQPRDPAQDRIGSLVGIIQEQHGVPPLVAVGDNPVDDGLPESFR